MSASISTTSETLVVSIQTDKGKLLGRTHHFVPVVVETSGAFGTESLDLFLSCSWILIYIHELVCCDLWNLSVVTCVCYIESVVAQFNPLAANDI